MKLKQFLKLYKGNNCITVYSDDRLIVEAIELEYDDITNTYTLNEEWLKKIEDNEVLCFQIMGGGIYPVELLIRTKKELVKKYL